MKKIMSIGLMSALTLVLSTGCVGTSPDAEAPNAPTKSAKASSEALYMDASNEKIIEIIKIAAHSTGWSITEFKSNEIIAEKTTDGNTISSIIKIYDGYIDFESHEASELKDAVSDAIKNKDKAHH